MMKADAALVSVVLTQAHTNNVMSITIITIEYQQEVCIKLHIVYEKGWVYRVGQNTFLCHNSLVCICDTNAYIMHMILL